MRWTWIWLGLCACGEVDEPDTTDDTPAATTGTIELSMRIEDDFGEAVLADGESLIGSFWGDVYLSDDVTALGPNEGAQALTSLHFPDVDLNDFDATPILATVADLEPGWVTVLGFFDSDGNADPEAPGPDRGDPVTMPNDNGFQVVAGSTTPAEIFLGFRNP